LGAFSICINRKREYLIALEHDLNFVGLFLAYLASGIDDMLDLVGDMILDKITDAILLAVAGEAHHVVG
jgi:hypothetical protein